MERLMQISISKVVTANIIKASTYHFVLQEENMDNSQKIRI